MTKQHTIEIEGLPEGWNPVAYRKAEKGEYYLIDGVILQADSQSSFDYVIVQKTKKRTFMLNGVELPCPLKDETDYSFEFGNTHFFYENEDDCMKVTNGLEKLFSEARDKE